MSSSVYIPVASGGGGGFTPPASISVKTASYTIPAGRYARIVAECDSGGTLTINAVTAITTAAFVNIDTQNTNSFNTITYTVPANYNADLFLVHSGTNQYVISGNIAIGNNTSNSPVNVPLGPAGSLLGNYSQTGFASITGYATPSNATNRQGQFFVPTGTVISGTGNWRAVVEEYTI